MERIRGVRQAMVGGGLGAVSPGQRRAASLRNLCAGLRCQSGRRGPAVRPRAGKQPQTASVCTGDAGDCGAARNRGCARRFGAPRSRCATACDGGTPCAADRWRNPDAASRACRDRAAARRAAAGNTSGYLRTGRLCRRRFRHAVCRWPGACDTAASDSWRRAHPHRRRRVGRERSEAFRGSMSGQQPVSIFRLGGANARIAVDYRQRVAGDAVPGSGPALTISTGF